MNINEQVSNVIPWQYTVLKVSPGGLGKIGCEGVSRLEGASGHKSMIGYKGVSGWKGTSRQGCKGVCLLIILVVGRIEGG